MPDDPTIPEPLARSILNAALNENRASELLDCLFAGGAATVDPSGTLCLATAEHLAAMMGNDDSAPPDEPEPALELLECIAEDLADLVNITTTPAPAHVIHETMAAIERMTLDDCRCLLLAAVVTIRTLRDTLRAKP